MTTTDSDKPAIVAGGGYAGVLAANRLVGRLGSLVSIEPERHTVRVERSPGAAEQLGYSALILALGSRFATSIPAHSAHDLSLRPPLPRPGDRAANR